MEHYRTKAAVKLIAQMTKDEALALLDVVRVVEEEFRNKKFSVHSLDKGTAILIIDEILADKVESGQISMGLVSQQMDILKKFLHLMVSERAHEDELLFEYNRALCPLLHYDLFKPDA